MKKFCIWSILIAFLITSTLVKTDAPFSGKHNYKIIQQDYSKIKITAVKKMQPVSQEITVRVVGYLVHNNKVQKIFLIDNRERKTKILLRKQRARSSIGKNEHMFYCVTSEHIQEKEFGLWKITRKRS